MLQAYVPVAARAVRLPRERNARLSLRLPLGAARPAAGLAVVLLHPFAGDARWRYRHHLSTEERRRWDAAQAVAAVAQRPQPPACGQLALLASLAPALHRGNSRGDAAACGGGSGSEGRLLEPCITAAAAFTLLPSGSQVGYSIISLDGLLSGSQESQVRRASGVQFVQLCWVSAAWAAEGTTATAAALQLESLRDVPDCPQGSLDLSLPAGAGLDSAAARRAHHAPACAERQE